jgi:hypothetical protein
MRTTGSETKTLCGPQALAMERISRLKVQMSASPASVAANDMFVAPRDVDCPHHVYDAVLSPAALAFVAEVAAAFRQEVDQVRPHLGGSMAFLLLLIWLMLVGGQLHARRQARRLATEQHGKMPHFLEETRGIREDATWRVDPQPKALLDRRVDIGDVSPTNGDFLLRALNSGAQVGLTLVKLREWTGGRVALTF